MECEKIPSLDYFKKGNDSWVSIILEFLDNWSKLNFYNSCKYIYFNVKHRYFKYNFNSKYSTKFVINKDFRNIVKKLIKKIHSLDLSYCSYNSHYKTRIKDVSMLEDMNCDKINLKGSWILDDISKLGNVKELNLERCNQIKDISKLGNQIYLNLCGCDRITNVDNLGKTVFLT